jgi:hypothetical protein
VSGDIPMNYINNHMDAIIEDINSPVQYGVDNHLNQWAKQMVSNSRRGLIASTMAAGLIFCSPNAAMADGAVPDAPKPVVVAEKAIPSAPASPKASPAPASTEASSIKVAEWKMDEKAATDKAIADF